MKDECLIFDLILTMYNLDLTFNDLSFDDSLHFGTVFIIEKLEFPVLVGTVSEMSLEFLEFEIF